MQTNGYVYFGIDESKRYIKIGKSKDPIRRQKEIRNMNPTFKIVFTFHPDQVTETEAEAYLHALYIEKRVYGEWFDLSVDDLFNALQGNFSREHIAQMIGREL